MSEYTKGPWTAHKSHGLNSFEIRSGEAYLADVWGVDHPVPNGVGRGAVKANARLIAAAPELLAACKLALEARAETSDERERRRDICRAAIEKAEGR